MNSLLPGTQGNLCPPSAPTSFFSYIPTYLDKRNLSHCKHHLIICVLCMSAHLFTHIYIFLALLTWQSILCSVEFGLLYYCPQSNLFLFLCCFLSSHVPFNFIFPSYSCAKYVLRCILVSAIWIQSFKCICFEIYIYTKYEASIIYSHFSGYFIGWDLPCLIQPPAVCSYFNVNNLKRNKM